jgi:hypothetical protein
MDDDLRPSKQEFEAKMEAVTKATREIEARMPETPPNAFRMRIERIVRRSSAWNSR